MGRYCLVGFDMADAIQQTYASPSRITWLGGDVASVRFGTNGTTTWNSHHDNTTYGFIVRDVAVDENGWAYTLDGKESVIRTYDPAGNHYGTVGLAENWTLTNALQLHLSATEIAVLDNTKRFTTYDRVTGAGVARITAAAPVATPTRFSRKADGTLLALEGSNVRAIDGATGAVLSTHTITKPYSVSATALTDIFYNANDDEVIAVGENWGLRTSGNFATTLQTIYGCAAPYITMDATSGMIANHAASSNAATPLCRAALVSDIAGETYVCGWNGTTAPNYPETPWRTPTPYAPSRVEIINSCMGLDGLFYHLIYVHEYNHTPYYGTRLGSVTPYYTGIIGGAAYNDNTKELFVNDMLTQTLASIHPNASHVDPQPWFFGTPDEVGYPVGMDCDAARNLLYTCDPYNKRITIFDTSDGTKQAHFDTAPFSPRYVTWHAPSDKLYVVGNVNVATNKGTLRVYDPETGLYTYELADVYGQVSYNPTTENVYAFGGTIYANDAVQLNGVTQFSIPNGATDAVRDTADGSVYACYPDMGHIRKYDSGGSLVDTWDVTPFAPRYLALNEHADVLYATNAADTYGAELRAYAIADGSVLGVARNIYGRVACNDTSDHVYAIQGTTIPSYSILVRTPDLRTNIQTIGSLSGGNSLHMTFNTDATRGYACDFAAKQVRVTNNVGSVVSQFSTAPRAPYYASYNAFNGLVYVLCDIDESQRGTLVAYNVTTGAVVYTRTNVYGMVGCDPDTGKVFLVHDPGTGQIVRQCNANLTLAAILFDEEGTPSGVSYHHASDTLYVVDRPARAIRVYVASTGALDHSISVDPYIPYQCAYHDDMGLLYTWTDVCWNGVPHGRMRAFDATTGDVVFTHDYRYYTGPASIQPTTNRVAYFANSLGRNIVKLPSDLSVVTIFGTASASATDIARDSSRNLLRVTRSFGYDIVSDSIGHVAAARIGPALGANVNITLYMGAAGNSYSVLALQSLDINAPLSVALVGTMITITLGTDGAGNLDNAKNMGHLVAAAIDALDIRITAYGAAQPLLPEGPNVFTGGTNASQFSTIPANTGSVTVVTNPITLLDGGATATGLDMAAYTSTVAERIRAFVGTSLTYPLGVCHAIIEEIQTVQGVARDSGGGTPWHCAVGVDGSPSENIVALPDVILPKTTADATYKGFDGAAGSIFDVLYTEERQVVCVLPRTDWNWAFTVQKIGTILTPSYKISVLTNATKIEFDDAEQTIDLNIPYDQILPSNALRPGEHVALNAFGTFVTQDITATLTHTTLSYDTSTKLYSSGDTVEAEQGWAESGDPPAWDAAFPQSLDLSEGTAGDTCYVYGRDIASPTTPLPEYVTSGYVLGTDPYTITFSDDIGFAGICGGSPNVTQTVHAACYQSWTHNGIYREADKLVEQDIALQGDQLFRLPYAKTAVSSPSPPGAQIRMTLTLPARTADEQRVFVYTGSELFYSSVRITPIAYVDNNIYLPTPTLEYSCDDQDGWLPFDEDATPFILADQSHVYRVRATFDDGAVRYAYAVVRLVLPNTTMVARRASGGNAAVTLYNANTRATCYYDDTHDPFLYLPHFDDDDALPNRIYRQPAMGEWTIVGADWPVDYVGWEPSLAGVVFVYDENAHLDDPLEELTSGIVGSAIDPFFGFFLDTYCWNESEVGNIYFVRSVSMNQRGTPLIAGQGRHPSVTVFPDGRYVIFYTKADGTLGTLTSTNTGRTWN